MPNEINSDDPSEQEKQTEAAENDCFKWGCIGLGGVFLLIVLILAILFGYVWFANPYGIKDWIFSPEKKAQEMIQQVNTSSFTISSSTIDKLPLSKKQLNLLQNAGVNLDKLKNKDPKQLKNCAKNKIGERKLKQLMSGKTQPSVSEMMSLKKCLN